MELLQSKCPTLPDCENCERERRSSLRGTRKDPEPFTLDVCN